MQDLTESPTAERTIAQQHVGRQKLEFELGSRPRKVHKAAVERDDRSRCAVRVQGPPGDFVLKEERWGRSLESLLNPLLGRPFRTSGI